jgi:hypothetical protein
MSHHLQQRIMQNGNGWYWEVITAEREVIGHGIADTHAQAVADAHNVQAHEPAVKL